MKRIIFFHLLSLFSFLFHLKQIFAQTQFFFFLCLCRRRRFVLRQLSIGIYIVERKLNACSDIYMYSPIFIRFIDNSNRCTVFTLVPCSFLSFIDDESIPYVVQNRCVIKSPLEYGIIKKCSEYEMEMKNGYKCIQTVNGKHESQSYESLSAIFT